MYKNLPLSTLYDNIFFKIIFVNRAPKYVFQINARAHAQIGAVIGAPLLHL
jgi:hypothetical protein